MTGLDKAFNSIHSNVRIFYDIAKESIEFMNALIKSGRRPKPSGEPGWIIAYDPAQKSFKAALIAITFSGIFLEALLHLLIVEKHGKETYQEYDRKTYEEKLILLGCTSRPIIEECKHYRIVRREIMHEKAHLDSKKILVSQKEATRAFRFIKAVSDHLGVNMN